MRRSPNAGSSSRSVFRRSEKARKPTIFAKVAITGLLTAGSAMRISSKATSAAFTTRVVRPSLPRAKDGSSWKSMPGRSRKV